MVLPLPPRDADSFLLLIEPLEEDGVGLTDFAVALFFSLTVVTAGLAEALGLTLLLCGVFVAATDLFTDLGAGLDTDVFDGAGLDTVCVLPDGDDLAAWDEIGFCACEVDPVTERFEAEVGVATLPTAVRLVATVDGLAVEDFAEVEAADDFLAVEGGVVFLSAIPVSLSDRFLYCIL